MPWFRVSVAAAFLSLLTGAVAQAANATQCQADLTQAGPPPNSTKVLILGGGMAGVIAARTLQQQGITDYVIVEAKHVFGGRMSQTTFGTNGSYVIEKGANWIHGTQTDNGPANPVWLLALKHNLSMVKSDLFNNITFFDYNGPNDYSATFDASLTAFNNARALAGERWQQNQTDLDLRSAYNYLGVSPKTPQEAACQNASVIILFDFAVPLRLTPTGRIGVQMHRSAELPADASQTSSLAAAWNYNYTFESDVGYSDVDMLSVDPRGFACIVQAEAATFLNTSQVLFNQTVTTIQYSQSGVTVQTESGYTLTADHALVTFSVGVLQGTDVSFEPALPDWKRAAISNIEMPVYTKIFLQFEKKFWFDTEIGLYADQQKGRYPVWQSLDYPGVYPGSGIIFVTVTGDYADYLEQLNKNTTQVQLEVMEVLRRMYPDAPDPIDIFLPVWGRAPLFRGSYSSWGASFRPQHSYELRAPVNGNLWFAGEGTSLKYFGFLQGAYLEGENAANNIAACIKDSTRCPSTS
ncbi:amine oxidase [Pisolithus croceorrhizus]|nr:amine oxidase [Pisolithus croceorrhizus]